MNEFMIVEQCNRCNKIVGGKCLAYINPGAWFRNGKHCPLASHIKTGSRKPGGKVRVGQQKQRKLR